MRASGRLLRRVGLEGLGWLLVLGGIAALILPGPGLLMIVAGLALLSQQYEWASRRLDPLKKRALESAADAVETKGRIAASVLSATLLLAAGVLWIVKPAVPSWWPIADKWWLVGGWGAGVSLVVSALIAYALIVYSIKNFRRIKANDPTP